jgi:murein tripeptide amidase MpaA
MIARSHPGETVSSWITKGFLEFIVSNDPVANSLRDRFIFKIIPMINPDGVIHGNYRCSLSGRDLNRRWKKPDRNLYPEVYFAKKLICDIGNRRCVDLVMDLHGHSRRKKMFMYGCNDWMNPMKCREFPYLLSKLNPNFEYRYCNFLI